MSWKRVLTEDDGNIGTNDLTIEGGTIRQLKLETETSQGTSLLIKGSPDSEGDYTIASFNAVQSGSDTITQGVSLYGQINIKGHDRPGGGPDTATAAGQLKLFESGSTQSNYVALQGGGSMSTNYIIGLPVASPGATGKILEVSGWSGTTAVLSWIDTPTGGSGGGVTGTGVAGRIAVWSDTDEINDYNHLYYTTGSSSLVTGNLTLTPTGTNGDGLLTCETSAAEEIRVTASGNTSADGGFGGGSRVFSKLGSGTVAAGKAYVLTSSGWVLADKDSTTTAIGLMAVATFRETPQNMLQEGVIKMASNQGFSSASAGDPLYLGDDGAFKASGPTGQNDVSRLVGYVVSASQKLVYFNPDQSYIVIS